MKRVSSERARRRRARRPRARRSARAARSAPGCRRGVAPSAMRMPSSRVPWLTRYAMHAVDADRGEPERERARTASAAASRSGAAPATRRRAPPSSARCRSADPDRSRGSPRGPPRSAPPGSARPRSTTFIAAAGILRVRKVHRDPRVGVERVLLDAADDADDGHPRRRRRSIRRCGCACRRRPRPARAAAPCARRRSRRAALSRVSCSVNRRPLEQRDLHRSEVVAGDDALVDVDERFAGRGVRPSTVIGPHANIWLSGSAETPPDGGHAGQRVEPLARAGGRSR